jgi:glycosyltransferase involved in cell wall biosynthesis
MSAADLFIHPASREGMSLAVLDAMSHGLAVVAANIPANIEAIADAGLLFPAGDEAALSTAIERLCTDQELRSRLAAAARSRSMALFAGDRFVSETATAYDDALSRSASQP